jgi:hypothetical protein
MCITEILLTEMGETGEAWVSSWDMILSKTHGKMPIRQLKDSGQSKGCYVLIHI